MKIWANAKLRKELLEWGAVVLFGLACWQAPHLWMAYQEWKLSTAPVIDDDISDRVG